MFGFSDVQFFISKIVPSPLKVVTPWVLAQEEEYIFESIFWIVYHLVIKPGQLIYIAMPNVLGNTWNDLDQWALNPGT